MISVIVPFYNAEGTIKRTIESLLNQLYKPDEIILVNDGSIDGSHTIIEKITNNLKVKLINQENLGVSTARNEGVKISSGDWLIFLDADDVLEDNALGIFRQAILRDPGIDLWLAGIRKTSNKNIVDKIPEPRKYLSKLSGSFCLRKSLFEQVGGYDSRLKYSENTELFHRIGLTAHKSGIIPEITLNYYDSADGGSKNLQNMIDSLTIILTKHRDTLSNHVKHLYHQIIGVNQMRFQNFKQAQTHLWKALKLRPFQLMTFGRLILSCFPVLSRRIYTLKIRK